jgi:hypothetical protein
MNNQHLFATKGLEKKKKKERKEAKKNKKKV